MTDSRFKTADYKPRPDFPLSVHPTGNWCKKVRGKLHYFGKVTDDPKGEAALVTWLDQKDDLLAGRKPRGKSNGELEVYGLCNQYLTAKLRLLKSDEITPRTFDDYQATTDRIIAELGKRRLVSDLAADDFDKLRSSLAKTLGAVALGNAIQRVRSVFNFAFECELIDKPVRFGPTFKKPSKKSIRIARAEKGPRLFTAADLGKLIKAADGQMKAMILLAINGGLGNSDIAAVPIRAFDLVGGWLDFPRPKTGIARRIPLWPETVAAVQAWLAKRPAPKDADTAQLVFVTKYGHAWSKLGRFNLEHDTAESRQGERERKRISSNNSLSKEFRKLTNDAGVTRTFYDLRHTFRTVGDAAKDQPAVNAIMGHADESMAAAYRESIEDSRLVAVSDYVRKWLFPKVAKGPKRENKTRQRQRPASSAA